MAAARTNPNDRVRIVRALEVFWLTGRPITAHHGERPRPLEGFRVLVVGLAPERARLRQAVAARTRQMLERGLLAEVEAVSARSGGGVPRPLGAIGYRQAVRRGARRARLDDAERSIVTETMRFAKRQMTWFRHQAEVAWSQTPDAAHAAVVGWLDG